MKLLRCHVCREYINHTKEHIRNHERNRHSYSNATYSSHIPFHHLGCKCVFCLNEKAKVVKKGEEKVGLQHFIGFGTDVETDVDGLALARIDNTERKEN